MIISNTLNCCLDTWTNSLYLFFLTVSFFSYIANINSVITMYNMFEKNIAIS